MPNGNSLDLKDIIEAINFCQQESVKFSKLAETLTKCAVLVQNILQQQSNSNNTEETAPSKEGDIMGTPAES